METPQANVMPRLWMDQVIRSPRLTAPRTEWTEEIDAPTLPPTVPPTDAERAAEYAAFTKADVEAEPQIVLGRVWTPEDSLDELAGKRSRQAEIERPFQEQIDALTAQMDAASADLAMQIAHLESEIKAAALARGKSIKGHALQCVWSKARVSWDDKFLLGYASAGHAEIIPARKVGDPSAVIREVK